LATLFTLHTRCLGIQGYYDLPILHRVELRDLAFVMPLSLSLFEVACRQPRIASCRFESIDISASREPCIQYSLYHQDSCITTSEVRPQTLQCYSEMKSAAASSVVDRTLARLLPLFLHSWAALRTSDAHCEWSEGLPPWSSTTSNILSLPPWSPTRSTYITFVPSPWVLHPQCYQVTACTTGRLWSRTPTDLYAHGPTISSSERHRNSHTRHRYAAIKDPRSARSRDS
jgi:hypothetical protein